MRRSTNSMGHPSLKVKGFDFLIFCKKKLHQNIYVEQRKYYLFLKNLNNNEIIMADRSDMHDASVLRYLFILMSFTVTRLGEYVTLLGVKVRLIGVEISLGFTTDWRTHTVTYE